LNYVFLPEGLQLITVTLVYLRLLDLFFKELQLMGILFELGVATTLYLVVPDLLRDILRVRELLANEHF